MRKPEPIELIYPREPDKLSIAVPIFAAEAVVIVALFMGAVITINGHALWAVIVGLQ